MVTIAENSNSVVFRECTSNNTSFLCSGSSWQLSLFRLTIPFIFRLTQLHKVLSPALSLNDVTMCYLVSPFPPPLSPSHKAFTASSL